MGIKLVDKNYSIREFLKNLRTKAKKKSKLRAKQRAKDREYIRLLFRIEHYPTLLSQEIKHRYKHLVNLKSVDENQKNQINRRIVRLFAARLSKTVIQEDRFHILREWLYSFANLGFLLSVGLLYLQYRMMIVSYRGFSRGSLGYDSVWEYLIAIFPVIVLLIIYNFIFGFLAQRISFNKRVFLIFVILIFGTWYLSNPSTPNKIYVFGIVGLEIIRSLSIIIDSLIYIGFENYNRKHLPEEVIVYNTLLVLYEIDDGIPPTLFARTNLATRLEYAASYIERYIYSGLKTSDQYTNDWAKDETKKIAAALREKKKYIYLAKPETTQRLRRSLVEFLTYFIKNDWGKLEKLKIPQRSWRENLNIYAKKIIGSLIFGLLPLSALLLLQQLNYLPEFLNESILGIAVVWALVNILWLDPSAKDKLGVMKDASGIVLTKK